MESAAMRSSVVKRFPAAGYALAKRSYRRMHRSQSDSIRRDDALTTLGWLDLADAALAARAESSTGRGRRLRAQLKRCNWLPVSAHLALELGEPDRAQGYADQLMDGAATAETVTGDWPPSLVRRQLLVDLPRASGTVLRGRIALARGDGDEAGAALAAAVEIPGAVDVHRPSQTLILAQDLAFAGHTDYVITCLRRAAERNPDSAPQIQDWLDQFASGRIPNLDPRGHSPRLSTPDRA